jgi:Ni,Fe-hydrogenase maturation factor
MSAIESALLLKEIHPELSNTELIFVGVEPSDMSVGEELSPAVEAAMPRLIEKILGLLRE